MSSIDCILAELFLENAGEREPSRRGDGGGEPRSRVVAADVPAGVSFSVVIVVASGPKCALPLVGACVPEGGGSRSSNFSGRPSPKGGRVVHVGSMVVILEQHTTLVRSSGLLQAVPLCWCPK